MGTYRVPRDTKGESRILVVFSTKALIYTIVGVGIGYLINVILNAIGIGGVGIAIMVILAVIGFSVATFKIPNISSTSKLSAIAGENIDEAIIKYFKHRKNKNKIYIVKDKEEEVSDGK